MEKEYYQPIVIKNFSKPNDVSKQHKKNQDSFQKESVIRFQKQNKNDIPLKNGH